MSIKRTIIWDWNGTLLDDVDICVNIINEMLKLRDKKPLNIASYKNIFTFPVKSYYQKAGFDFEEENWDAVAHEFIDNYLNQLSTCKLSTYALEALQIFKKHTFNQAIISAMNHESLLESVKQHNIEHYFDYIGGINNHFADGKTQNALNYITQFDINPTQIILIGDTLHDAEIAQQINCKCLLVANGHQSYERLIQSGFKVFNSLQELVPSFMY